jgi:dinuclear metal center YbgI/SA1388 family protein
MTMTVREIHRVLDRLAPPALAESWDNVGLLVGDPAQPVEAVLVALDATPGALAQAAEVGAGLIVTHHPLIFSPLKRVVEDRGVAMLVRGLVRQGCSLIAAHTNLDAAPDGLNAYVATLLGLTDTRPLLSTAARPLLKLVVYVPEAHVDAVRAAITGAGAGWIGHYAECSFSARGVGTFRPEEGTHPFIGTPGTLERLAEERLETVVPKAALGAVLAAMTAAHPYEEVAYDLLPLENAWPGAGLGRIGTLAEMTTAGAFLRHASQVLGTTRLSLAGPADRPVRTVALCTGSGGDFMETARHAGADLYLTGEVKHHHALLARQAAFPVIDAGHYPTERPAVELLAGYLERACPGVRVIRAVEADPWER